ncbi:hypothetical protein GA0115253_106971, partial [Streptomyces sp. Termitarium-T10T-6]
MLLLPGNRARSRFLPATSGRKGERPPAGGPQGLSSNCRLPRDA